MSQVSGKKIKSQKVVGTTLEGIPVLPVYSLATLPAASAYPHALVVCSNGGGAGTPTLAYSNGTVWKAITIGSTLASS